MKTMRVKLWKAVAILSIAIGIPSFIVGWVVAVNFSGVFETGYRVAFYDIESAVREALEDRQVYFYKEGLKFYPLDDRSVKILISKSSLRSESE